MSIFGVDSAHGGENWNPRKTSTIEEKNTLWQGFGVDSEYAELKRVILHRPGEEIEQVKDPLSVDWYECINRDKAIEQIDNLTHIYQMNNVETLFLNPQISPKPNHIFMRDLFCMTPQGAILSRMAGESRKGEEIDLAIALTKNKIPIAGAVQGHGIFEGPDLLFYNPNKVFLAESVRSNILGVRQIQATLQSHGIDVFQVQTTYGCGHLDGVVSLVNSRLALVHPRRVSYTLCRELEYHGYIVKPLPSETEANTNMAINIVSINPELALIIKGNLKTQKLLNENGVETIEMDLSEIMKGGGGVHCITGILERENNQI